MGRLHGTHSFGLDVVRCAAIALVLLCHCGLAFSAWCLLPRPADADASGYFGVELFFVLSGFLIGGILLDLAAGRPTFADWRVFVARRWLRTLPLYAICLGVLATFWPPGTMHDDRTAAWRDLARYATFTQNLAWPQPDWFVVSWSLSIEEWFYLAFSALLLCAARVAGARASVAISLGLFLVLPPLLRFSEPLGTDWNEILRKAVLFRLDAIAIGVAVVAINRARPCSAPLGCWLFGAGVATILAQAAGLLPFSHAHTRLARALSFDVTDLGFASMLPAAASLPTPPAWLARPVRGLAARSYGVYLTHQTIIEMVGFARYRTHWSGLLSGVIASALIVAIPLLTWRAIELPFIALRPVGRERRLPATTVAGGSRRVPSRRDGASAYRRSFRVGIPGRPRALLGDRSTTDGA